MTESALNVRCPVQLRHAAQPLFLQALQIDVPDDFLYARRKSRLSRIHHDCRRFGIYSIHGGIRESDEFEFDPATLDIDFFSGATERYGAASLRS
jgi:hypothetical protein